MKLFVFVMTFFLFISGCQENSPIPTSIPPTQNAIPAQITVTEFVPPATPTETHTPAIIPSITPTDIPISTPTSMPSATVTPWLSSVPEWITDPAVNVLLLGNIEYSPVTIFNVDTGEQLNVRAREVIDILAEIGIKLPTVNQDTFSPNGRYEVQITRQENGTDSVTIVDHETQTENKLFNPFQHLQSLDEPFFEYALAYWSPDGMFLSVTYEKNYYSDNSDYNLAIYTPMGEIFRQYAGMSLMWKNSWSPVETNRILFIEGRSPCILEVISNKKTCPEIVNKWATNQNVSPFGYAWSPDGKQISFVYENSDSRNSGLCYFDLAKENITCPVTSTDLLFEKQMFAGFHFWSPDGKYLVLFFDEVGIRDVMAPQRVVVVNVANQNLQFLEGEFSWPYTNPWRPLIPSQTNE
ncbi:MAG: hypothetical protein H6667_03810 [Ardenticatenaceae bacterium]|nr:hypothetical protein [Ardenticatenaceae bacterium]